MRYRTNNTAQEIGLVSMTAEDMANGLMRLGAEEETIQKVYNIDADEFSAYVVAVHESDKGDYDTPPFDKREFVGVSDFIDGAKTLFDGLQSPEKEKVVQVFLNIAEMNEDSFDWEERGNYRPTSDDRYEARRDAMNESINDPSYTHYAVLKPINKIVNGWDYSDYDPEDLKVYRNDYFFDDLRDAGFNPRDIKILTTKGLMKAGLDPNDDSNWDNGFDYVNESREQRIRGIVRECIERVMSRR